MSQILRKSLNDWNRNLNNVSIEVTECEEGCVGVCVLADLDYSFAQI